MSDLVAIRFSIVPLAMAVCFLAAVPPQPPRAGAAISADRLIEQVMDAKKTSGFRMRATLTHITAGSGAKNVRQLLIKGRRDGDATMTLYQVLWPSELAGQALVIEDPGDHRTRGFLYEAGTATPLTDAELAERLFDSDLRIEDVVDGFWFWPYHRIAGEDAVEEHRCVLIDFRPGPDTPTVYSLVRTCVAPDLVLSLRVEQFGRAGELVKQIVAGRLVRWKNRWLAGTLTVTTADRQSRTVLAGSKYEPDLQVPAVEFTMDAIRSFPRPTGGP